MADTSTRGRGKVAPAFAAKGSKEKSGKPSAKPAGKAKAGKKSAPPWMQKFAEGGCVMPKSKMFESNADYQKRAYAGLKDCDVVMTRSEAAKPKPKPVAKATPVSSTLSDYATGATTKKRMKDAGLDD